MDKTYDKLLQYALKIIVKKRYTKHEMIKKLGAYCEKSSINLHFMDDVMTRIIELGYIDDSKFVVDYISDRCNLAPRGIRLIRQELKYKGVKKELIDNLINSAKNIDEVSMASELIEKKRFKFDKFSGIQKKNKIFAFLYSKGFMPDAIYKALRSCYSDVDK